VVPRTDSAEYAARLGSVAKVFPAYQPINTLVQSSVIVHDFSNSGDE
jgi:hypothetical protein